MIHQAFEECLFVNLSIIIVSYYIMFRPPTIKALIINPKQLHQIKYFSLSLSLWGEKRDVEIWAPYSSISYEP